MVKPTFTDSQIQEINWQWIVIRYWEVSHLCHWFVNPWPVLVGRLVFRWSSVKWMFMPHLHRLIAHPLQLLTTCWYLRTRRGTQAVKWSFPLYQNLFIWKWRWRVKLYLTTCFNLLPLIRTHNDWCPCSPSEYSIIKSTSLASRRIKLWTYELK